MHTCIRNNVAFKVFKKHASTTSGVLPVLLSVLHRLINSFKILLLNFSISLINKLLKLYSVSTVHHKYAIHTRHISQACILYTSKLSTYLHSISGYRPERKELHGNSLFYIFMRMSIFSIHFLRNNVHCIFDHLHCA